MDEDTKELCRIYSRPHKFLMVGDNHPFVDVLKVLMPEYNCTFTFAYTYVEAVAAITRLEDFDSVWIDLDLNCGHTASEVLQAVKVKQCEMPVVILFNDLNEGRLQRMQEIKRTGIAYFLIRPETPDRAFFDELFGFMRIPKTSLTPTCTVPELAHAV